MKPATSIDQARDMESQDRAARHADAVLGHCTQHERAGRQAWAVDHDSRGGEVGHSIDLFEHLRKSG